MDNLRDEVRDHCGCLAQPMQGGAAMRSHMRTRSAMAHNRRGCPRMLSVGAIPCTVHQSWATAVLPDVLGALSGRWNASLPRSWKHMLWTDADNRRLWQAYAPSLITVYDNYKSSVERADATRFLYMSVYGGVYADLDVVPCLSVGDSIRHTLASHRIVLVRDPWRGSLERKRKQHISNFFMAGVPGHPFWNFALQGLQARQHDGRGAMYTTGPYYMDHAYKRFLREYRKCPSATHEIAILTHDEWQAEHIAMHHWTSTWHTWQGGAKMRERRESLGTAQQNLQIMENVGLLDWLGVNLSKGCPEALLDNAIGPSLVRTRKMKDLYFLSMRPVNATPPKYRAKWCERGRCVDIDLSSQRSRWPLLHAKLGG